MTPAARTQAAIDLLNAIAGAAQPAAAAAAQPAAAVVTDWFRRRRYAGSGDRAAIAELVYVVLRRRQQIDWWLARAGGAPDARNRILAALALDGGKCEEIAARFDGGRYGPAPLDSREAAVLERLSGQSFDHPEQPGFVAANCPEWLYPKLCEAFGDSAPAELAALSGEARVDLRVNALKADRATAIATLAEDGVAAEPTPFSPVGLRLGGRTPLSGTRAFRDGLVEPQDEASQLAVLLTDAHPGDRVADYCAGAGGKTLALAAAMANRGRILACDRSRARLDRAAPRLKRAGVTIVEREVLTDDGADRLARCTEGFARVLVDAPCSGTGRWRRGPDEKWRLAPTNLDRLRQEQAVILDKAAMLVAPGGRLVYATCSVLREENEAQAGDFLARQEEFRLLPIGEVWRAVLGGACPAEGEMLRLTPARHGTDGFFIAILERTPGVGP